MTSISGIGNTSSVNMAAMREKMFNKTDIDGDGLLSKSEMKDAFENRKAEQGSSRKAETGDGPNLDELFSNLDGDGDGMLSKEEMEQMSPPSGPPPGPPPGSRRAEDGFLGTELDIEAFTPEYLEQKAIQRYTIDQSTGTVSQLLNDNTI